VRWGRGSGAGDGPINLFTYAQALFQRALQLAPMGELAQGMVGEAGLGIEAEVQEAVRLFKA
jgi:hypothetical protein